MKYVAPPGGSADASYVDGNRSAGTKGSIVPAAAIEHDQRELINLITYSGQTPSTTDLEQVRKAVVALIAAATGSGDTSQFLLLSQARARLPIYPEILSADGKMNVSSPAAGTILVPPTVSFQHRGIYPASTSDYAEAARTFSTAASKTYHLRWTPTGGFALRDVANAPYNPTALPESNPVFDSAYDDMLVARVVTNAGNVATVTNLVNKDRFFGDYPVVVSSIANPRANGSNGSGSAAWNLSRTPQVIETIANLSVDPPDAGGSIFDHDYTWTWSTGPTRYGATFNVMRDFMTGVTAVLKARL